MFRFRSPHLNHLCVSAGVHRRQLYRFCPVRPFIRLFFLKVFFFFLQPVLFVHLTECEKFVLGHVCLPAPGAKRGWPRQASGGGEGGKFACDGFPKWRILEGGHAACAAQLSEGKGVVGGGGGGGVGGSWVGGAYWHGLRMFSEARVSGSVARYDAEKCLAA